MRGIGVRVRGSKNRRFKDNKDTRIHVGNCQRMDKYSENEVFTPGSDGSLQTCRNTGDFCMFLM